MRRDMAVLLVLSLVGMLVAAPASTKGDYEKVKGEVIRVEQRVRTQNGGEYDRLTIRTRQGEEMKLRLGEGGACAGCFQEGDRVRARIRLGEGPEAECQVQFMKVRRERHMFKFQEQNGRLVQVRPFADQGARAGRQSGRKRDGGGWGSG